MSNNELITSGQLRRSLAESLDRVMKGNLTPQDAKSIIGISNQITTNIAVELKSQQSQLKLGNQPVDFGHLSLVD